MKAARDAGAGLLRPAMKLVGSVLLLAAMPAMAQEISLLHADPAVVRGSETRNDNGEAVLRVQFEAARGRLHALNLHPNRDLGAWSEALANRATAYAGDVGGYAGSWAAVTRIGNRWSGIWYDGGDYYGVDAAGALASVSETAAALPPAQLMVYRLRDMLWHDATLEGDTREAALDGEELIEQVNLGTESLHPGQPTRWLHMTVAADAQFAQQFGEEAEAMLMAQINVIDGVFANQLGVRVAAADIKVFDDSSAAPFSRTTATDALLDEVAAWRGRNLQQRATGVTHLFTGRDLDGRIVGMAFVDSLCSAKYAASLSRAAEGLAYTALIAAHEIGHVFGAPHDGDAHGACASTPADYLMAPRINGSQEFSACSIEQMTPAATAASCLARLPPENSSHGRDPASPLQGGGGALPTWQLGLLGVLVAARVAQRRARQSRANQSAR